MMSDLTTPQNPILSDDYLTFHILSEESFQSFTIARTTHRLLANTNAAHPVGTTHEKDLSLIVCCMSRDCLCSIKSDQNQIHLLLLLLLLFNPVPDLFTDHCIIVYIINISEFSATSNRLNNIQHKFKGRPRL